MKCKLSLLLTSFVLCFIFAFTSTLSVSAAYDDYFDWQGTFYFNSSSFEVVSMKANIANYWDYGSTSDSINVDFASVSYDGSFSDILTLTGLTPYSILDGKFILHGSITAPSDITDISYFAPYVSFHNYMTDSISVGGYTTSVSGKTVNFRLEIQFNEYYCTGSNFNIPLGFDVTSSVRFYNWRNKGIGGINQTINYDVVWSTEYAGSLKQYDDLQDNPSMDSYFAEQNQTIIDQSQTQNNLTTEQNALIQNQTNQQHLDSQVQINQSIANTDTMVNGFDTTESDKTSAELESNFSSLENAEADSIDFAQTALRGFSIPAGGIQGLAEGMTSSMSLVSSMAQAIFEASEAFGTIVVAVFALIIVGMVIGLAKFMR